MLDNSKLYHIAYVYVVEAESHPEFPVKIGVSRDMLIRIASLQACSPVKLRIFGGIACTYRVASKIEFIAHMKLESARVWGEWFQVEAATAVQTIEKIAENRQIMWRKMSSRECAKII